MASEEVGRHWVEVEVIVANEWDIGHVILEHGDRC